ncbi:MAG: sulfotransferase [Nitrospiraceae bacterium]|nr:sulfotransferase [Nitrospiraceae bacterium]
MLEKIRFGRKIRNVEIKPPVFIIGHWRSGTTYLHNLLSQNPNFAYPTTFQTVTPSVFLGSEKLIKPMVESSLPPTRPEDNVPLGADLPQEEEYAMGNLCPYSFYNGWCFPRKMDFYYKFVCMEDVPESAVEEWKRIYLYYLKKVALAGGGRKLVLKNPANTARINLLLEMFPDAKFVHIYRNPYHVFLSMKRDINSEMPLYSVQKPGDDDSIEKAMAGLYNHMFDKFFKEKGNIPDGNFTEVRYEDLIEKPLKEVERVHKELGLSGFEEHKNDFAGYIAAQSGIKPHVYSIDGQLKEKIYGYWKYTIDKWGYGVQ